MLVGMTLALVAEMFQRALRGVFNRTRFVLLFCALFVSGLLVIFFRGVAQIADGWWGSTLTLFPLFLALGLILAIEVVLVRLYVQGGGLLKTALKATDLMLRVSYCSIPLIIIFLCLWTLSGLFVLFQMIPHLGRVLGILLSFTPFILHLAMIALMVVGLYLSFVVSPLLALKQGKYRQRLKQRLQKHLFYDLVLFMVAFLPVWIIFKGLLLAAHLTFIIGPASAGTLEYALESFFVMIPFVSCLTPACLFFFNFAAEAQLAFDQREVEAGAKAPA